jgi:hypothetical protein
VAQPRAFLVIPDDLKQDEFAKYLRLVLQASNTAVSELDRRLRTDGRFTNERVANALRAMEGNVSLDYARMGKVGDILFLVDSHHAVWGSAANLGPGGVGPAQGQNILLDGLYHTDTLNHAVVAGDLIYGNATPKWTARAIGSAGQLLTVVGGLPAWATLDLSAAGGWTDDGTTVRLTTATDKVAIGTATAIGRFLVLNAGATTDVVATLKAIASQSGNMLNVLDSSGAVNLSIDKNGCISIGSPTASVNAVLAMGTNQGTSRPAPGPVSNHAVITWGDNGNALSAPGITADQIGVLGARFYTYKDQTGIFDCGYGQDAADGWVLINDDTVTYSIWSCLTVGGTPYLRAQWAGNGDMEQRGILNIKKCTKSAGSSAASTPALRLWSTGSSSPTKYVGLSAPATVTTTYTVTLPLLLPSTTATCRVSSAGTMTFDDTPATASTKSGATITTNTTQAADITTANLLASGHTAGMYRVSVVLEDTGADLTAGAVQVTIGWTDDVGATTANPTGGSGTFPLVLTAVGRAAGHVVLYSTGAAAITYATSHTGIFGTATYALRVRTEFLG